MLYVAAATPNSITAERRVEKMDDGRNVPTPLCIFSPTANSTTRIRVANAAAIAEEIPTPILKLFFGTYITLTLRIA